MAYNEILNPMPVIDSDAVISGTITAADAVVAAPAGDGTFRAGASTAGSYVPLACPGGDSAWIIQLTGTFGGTTIYYEGSVDSTNGVDGNWINLNGRQTGVVNTILSGNSTGVGFFRGNTSGLNYLRARAVGGAAISVTVKIRITSGEGAIFLNASIPAGTNIIGKTGIDQTTPGTTNKVSIGTDGTVAINAALPAGSAIIGALAVNQSVNTSQINGIAVSMGAGASGTGVQRVILATDNLPTAAAATDGLANPIISQLGADMMVFNGTSWDRQRGMSVATTTGDTGAKLATGNGATQTNVGNKGIQLFIVLGAVSGTTPTAVFKVQGSVDGGANFYDIPGATTASLIASINVGITVYPGGAVTAGAVTTGTTAGANGVLPRTWRVVWTLGGTTPSFSITSITYNYIPN